MNKWKALNFIKDKNNLMIIFVIVIGVMLMTSFSKTDNGREDITAFDLREERLEEILSDIAGAGNVSVMITYENTYEKQKSNILYDEKNIISDKTRTLTDSDNATVRGVIVIADGADDMKIKYELTKAVEAVLRVEAHRICIYKRK